MKTLSEVQQQIDYLCGPDYQLGPEYPIRSFDEKHAVKSKSKRRAEALFLHYVKVYLESSPTEDFVRKQIMHNEKRLKAIQSEIAAIADHSGMPFSQVESDKKFVNIIRMIENQNKMLNYILE